MNNKVWTYVIGKVLSPRELDELTEEGRRFVSEWTAHEHRLAATFEIIEGRIIVVKVNEDVNAASGCSIDKLTRFMKQAGARYGFDPMNRLLVAYRDNDHLNVAHASEIKKLLEQGGISEHSPVYNTAVANEQEFGQWLQPLKSTWLKKFLQPS